MELSKCCDYPIILTDICNNCKEHCEIYNEKEKK